MSNALVLRTKVIKKHRMDRYEREAGHSELKNNFDRPPATLASRFLDERAAPKALGGRRRRSIEILLRFVNRVVL